MAGHPPVHAVRRFGLGARPGDLHRAGSDPRGYLLGQLEQPDKALVQDAKLEASDKLLAEQQKLQFERRMMKKQLGLGKQARARNVNGAAGAAPKTEGGDTAAKELMTAQKPGKLRRQAYIDDGIARLRHSIATDAPFVERLVLFWSNHFCVSAAKGQVRGIVGAFEREAIRPHVLGRFADMLRAVEQHPAMLIYLDNRGSIGPNSIAGRRRNKGLNENLAREILELHTVGVNAGYSQGDVTNLARILTGWSITNVRRHGDNAGRFFFARNQHEPGEWSVLGKRYRDNGQATGEDVLRDLAHHPATARHIATKLAVHFHSDNPPPALVQRLADTFQRTQGDLRELSRALVLSPELWSEPARKVVPPYDFVVSMMRGLDVNMRPRLMFRVPAALGQPLWTPPSPKGWPDGDMSWAAPSSIRERLRIAHRVAVQASRRTGDPRAIAADLFGDGLSKDTRVAIARAESVGQGYQLLIMSTEFQRR